MAARFVTAATDAHLLPNLGLPEFAFIGRSNVGKSSLLAMVLGQRKLVRISRTPGRTRELNLFELDQRYALVDLPGYGYAHAAKRERAFMQDLIAQYVFARQTVSGVVLVVDARREEGMPADRAMAGAVVETGRPLLVVVTKMDLVPKNRGLGRLRQIETALRVPAAAAVAASAKTGQGRAEILARFAELAS
jgi:GTP-binding protein